MRAKLIILSFIPLIWVLTACNFNTDEITPTAEGIVEEPINPLPENTEITPTESPTPSLTPSPTAEIVQIVTNTLPPTAIPTETPLPTETPGPWEYIIQPGDTLGFIIQQPPFNYPYDPAVIAAVVALNENIPNENVVPPIGSTIFIPRPTPIPIISDAQIGGTPISGQGPVIATRRVGVAGPQGCHTIQDGETAVGIVEQYGGMTLEIFSQLNGGNIVFAGCNFEEPSGGPNCNPILVVGQCVNVLLATATPTLSPTPSGSETPTFTPTYRAPSMISPPDGAVVSGSKLRLQWDSVGVLEPQQYYLVQVRDTTTGATWADITKNQSIEIDASIVPSDGQKHDIEWNVSIATANQQGQYAPIGYVSEFGTFQWQG